MSFEWNDDKEYMYWFMESVHEHGVDLQNRVIYVSSESVDENGETGVDAAMSARFIKNIDILNTTGKDDITVKMSSCGGCWNQGMAMFDAISKSKAKVICESFAHARSMSSIIPQAASVRRIHAHCDFMIHLGTLADDGHYQTVMSGMEYTKKMENVMFDIYAKRCFGAPFCEDYRIKTRKQVADFFKEQVKEKSDWWMTARDAVYYGFMDEVI